MQKRRHQYMYGADILVAPVVEAHAVSRRVYLPQNCKWTLAGTGEIFEGGQWVEVKAAIDTLPLFQLINLVIRCLMSNTSGMNFTLSGNFSIIWLLYI